MTELLTAASSGDDNGASRLSGVPFDLVKSDRLKPDRAESGRAESVPVKPDRAGPGRAGPDGARLGGARLRALLRQLAETRQFLGSPEGREFLGQLEQHLVPGVRAAARRLGLGDDWAQPQEILHTIIVGLCADGGRVATHIADSAIDPWAYLAKCSITWARELWGSRGMPLDQISESRVEACLTVQQHQAHNDALTSIDRAVALTYRALVPHTPRGLGRPLSELLSWLANNPPQRVSHETADRAAAAQAFQQFSPTQLAAVVNIAWGGRPRRRETSLLAAFLLNPDFRPSNSPTHARALLQYRRVMRSQQVFEVPAQRLAA